MVFSSHIFLFYFLPIFLGIYFLMVNRKVNLSWINLWITVSSYVFYGWFEPWFVTLMWISTIVDYACGRAISDPQKMDPGQIARGDIRAELSRLNVFYPVFLFFGYLNNFFFTEADKKNNSMRNIALGVSMVVNLGLLGFFKYYMFVMGGINNLAELLGAGPNFFRVLSITLPIGISFYTFQTMSYTIDVWRGDAPPVKDMRTFSCFVALFPQLIAGPIIRYNTVAEQLAYRKHSVSKFASGASIFILGYAKKILLADAAAPVADAAFAADSPNTLTAWWGILAYHFQIYFDFCAYSDMAVGLGRMMGFEFIKNFNAPYRAQSISDFWNRWHISLSTWIRDYLYIGLGGNRKGPRRTYFNLGLSMFLCGVWHGAQMTFIIWGVLHGAFLIWERTMGRQPLYKNLPPIVKIVITNCIVMFIWVFFKAPEMSQAWAYWKAMVGLNQPALSAGILQSQLFSVRHVVEMAICAFFIWQPFQAHEWVEKLTGTKYFILIALFILAIIGMFTNAFSPFLYFQF